jgi:hypothetical protein
MVVVAGTAAFYLAGGNAELLSQLYQRFATGPIDWPKPR